MQIIGFVDLYKTPLDANYSNVYDEYSSTTEYKSFLDNNFSPLHITTDFRSRVDNSGEFDLEIAGYNSIFLHDYNYIAFGTDYQASNPLYSKIKFAFITSISSLNDSYDAPTCRLRCKLDVWSNHYLELKNSAIYSKVRRMIPPSNIQYYIGKNKNLQFGVKRYPATALNQTIIIDNKVCTIIWERMQISDKMVTENNTAIYSATYDGSGKYVYRPVGVIDLETRKLVSVTLTFVDSYSQHEYAINCNSDYLALYYRRKHSDYVLSLDLTVWVPFRYYLSNGFLTVPNQLTYASVGYFEGAVYHEEFIGFYRATNSRYTNVDRNISLPMTLIPTVPNMQELIDNNRFLCRYPFYYYSLYSREGEIPLVPSENTATYVINVAYTGRLYPEISLDFENQYVTGYKTVPRLPSCYIEYSEIANYLRNNSNQLALQEHYLNMSNILAQTEAAGKMFLAFQGLGTSGIISSTNDSIKSLYNLSSYYANLEDKKRIMGASITGEISNTYEYLDDITIIMNNAYDYNTIEIEHIAKDMCYYGIEVDGIVNILDNTHVLYDYAECINPMINAKIANDDRRELLNALTSGIRRWHITANPVSFDISQLNERIFIGGNI